MHRTSHMDRRIELTLFDPNNARSLTALLPEAFAHQIKHLWDGENSHLLKVGEVELKKIAKRVGRPITPQDHRLRIQFWFEYDQQQESPDRHYPELNMSRIIGKACTKESFYKHVITDPVKLAWILTPPVDYQHALETALTTATLRMIEIMEMPLQFPDGSPDYSMIEKMSRITENFHRYIRSWRGEIVNTPKEGRRPGQKMSQGKIEEAKPKETLAERAERLKLENEQLRANLDKQANGVGQAEQ